MLTFRSSIRKSLSLILALSLCGQSAPAVPLEPRVIATRCPSIFVQQALNPPVILAPKTLWSATAVRRRANIQRLIVTYPEPVSFTRMPLVTLGALVVFAHFFPGTMDVSNTWVLALSAYDPERHLTLSVPEFKRWMTQAEAQDVVRAVKIEADRLAGGRPKEEGRRLTVGQGQDAFDLISQKRGVSIEWVMDRAAELVLRAARFAGVELTSFRTPDQRLNPVNSSEDVVISVSGFLKWGLGKPGALQLLKQLEKPTIYSKPMVLTVGDRVFTLTPKLSGTSPVWTFRYVDREVVSEKFQFLLPPEPNEEGIDERSLKPYLVEVEKRWLIVRAVAEQLGKAPDHPKVVWVGDGDHRVRFIARKIRFSSQWFVDVTDVPKLPQALGIPETLEFQSPEIRHVWRKYEEPSPLAVLAPLVEAFMLNGDLSESVAQLPEEFELKARSRGAINFGTFGPYRVALDRSHFAPNSSLKVKIVRRDPKHPEWGVTFTVTGTGKKLKLQLSPEGSYLEPVPETGEQALYYYVRDKACGRSLAPAVYDALHSGVSEFTFRLGKNSIWALPKIRGKPSRLLLSEAPGKTLISARMLANDPHDLSQGLRLEAETDLLGWDIEVLAQSPFFRVDAWHKRQSAIRRTPGDFSRYIEAFGQGSDLKKVTMALKARKVRAINGSELIFGTGPQGVIRLFRSPFPAGTIVDVVPVPFHTLHPEWGAYFRLSAGNKTMDVRYTTEAETEIGQFIEALPANGPAAVLSYLRDRLSGAHFAASSWRLLTQFSEFDVVVGAGSHWDLRRTAGNIPTAVLAGAQPGSVVRVRAQELIASDPSGGAYFDISQKTRKWIFEVTANPSVFQSWRGGPGYAPFLAMVRTMREAGSNRLDFSDYGRDLNRFALRALDGGVLFRELGWNRLLPLPGVRKGDWVIFEPFTHRLDSTQEPYFRITSGSRAWIGHPSAENYVFQIFNDGSLVARKDGVWIKRGEQARNHPDGSVEWGYLLERWRQPGVKVINWIGSNGLLTPARPDKPFIDLTIDHSLTASQKKALKFLARTVDDLANPVRRLRLFNRASESIFQPDQRLGQNNTYAKNLRWVLATGTASGDLDKLRILGFLLNQAVNRLARAVPYEVALFSNGDNIVQAQPGRVSLELVVLRKSSRPLTSFGTQFLVQCAIEIGRALGLSVAGHVVTQPLLSPKGKLIVFGKELTPIFRPLVAGDAALVEKIRSQAISQIIRKGGARLWKQICSVLYLDAEETPLKHPSLREMRDIFKTVPAFVFLGGNETASVSPVWGGSLLALGVLIFLVLPALKSKSVRFSYGLRSLQARA